LEIKTMSSPINKKELTKDKFTVEEKKKR